jgi:hypothetical protein
MDTQVGPAWLDLGSDATPSIDAVAAAISQNHPKCVLTGSQVQAHAKPVAIKTCEVASES